MTSHRLTTTTFQTRLFTLILHILTAFSYNLPFSRRHLIENANTLASAISFGFASSSAVTTILWTCDSEAAVTELPSFVRPYTNLAYLGPFENTPKTRGLSLEELKHRLEHDLTFGTRNNGGYFITGDLSTDIFRDDCVFLDPTNQVSSLSQYQKAVKLLFDPNTSFVELIEPLSIDTEQRRLSGRIRSRGMLKLPWHPFVSAYESKVVYSIDQDGLVARQEQVWSKTAETALKETFTPTINTPPPRCCIPKPDDEPVLVTKLFDKVNGRRPNEYSPDERSEIANLVNEISEKEWPWSDGLLPGKWMLTYLQQGPQGGGIDRRIPFPEFDFNDSFQIFSNSDDPMVGSVQNVGQVLGPVLEVHVTGSLQANDINAITTPKRFSANIHRGELCVAGNNTVESGLCIPLPISGVGLFDGLYLGQRLRIGQNLNGGGARVVQVRVG